MSLDTTVEVSGIELLRRHKIMTLDQAQLFLEERVDSLENATYQKLCDRVLGYPDCWKCPAAKGRHQAYPGGLAIHTAQVLCTALDMLQSVEAARLEEVIVAVIWHDVGKIEEYKIESIVGSVPQYEYTQHKALIGHLAKSFSLFWTASENRPLSDDDQQFIGHLILAHHGRKEWGSPVEPQCAEAWAIHAADMLSANNIEDAP